MSSLSNVYKKHHNSKKREGFSVLEKERGVLFREMIGQNKNIMDMGCRDGVLTKYFLKSNTVLGVDIDDSLLKKAERELGIKTLVVDLNNGWSELNDKKFNCIVAGEIIEHLYFPELIFEKVSVHLDAGGMFIGSVPNAFSLKNRFRLFLGKKKNTPLGDPTHINHFSYIELKNMLSKYFKDVGVIGLGRYKLLSRIFPGIFAFDLVFYAKK